MSFCDEHGTSDYCPDCMAEIMQKTIDYQQAHIKELEQLEESNGELRREMDAQLAKLEAENQRLRSETLEWFSGRAGDIVPNRYYQRLYRELKALLGGGDEA